MHPPSPPMAPSSPETSTILPLFPPQLSSTTFPPKLPPSPFVPQVFVGQVANPSLRLQVSHCPHFGLGGVSHLGCSIHFLVGVHQHFPPLPGMIFASVYGTLKQYCFELELSHFRLVI